MATTEFLLHVDRLRGRCAFFCVSILKPLSFDSFLYLLQIFDNCDIFWTSGDSQARRVARHKNEVKPGFISILETLSKYEISDCPNLGVCSHTMQTKRSKTWPMLLRRSKFSTYTTVNIYSTIYFFICFLMCLSFIVSFCGLIETNMVCTFLWK